MTTAESPEIAAEEQQNGAQRPLDLRTLFDAGVHFGHPSKRWNPKMEKFIFTKRARSHIFDLAKTVEATEKAKDYLRRASAAGAQVMIVGTKKQAQEAVKEQSLRCGAWYINQRWLGGMLTNFQTIQKRIERLVYLEDAIAKGTLQTQTKRESLRLETEMNRLNNFFGGIKEMNRLPDILFIVDTEKEDIAVREARRLGIPIVAIVDTNSNPDDADFIIPGNDDAVRSVNLLTAHIADAILEGKNQHLLQQRERLAADAELEAQEAAARAAAQALAAERAAAAQAEKQRKQTEVEEAAKAAASAAPEVPAAPVTTAEEPVPPTAPAAPVTTAEEPVRPTAPAAPVTTVEEPVPPTAPAAPVTTAQASTATVAVESAEKPKAAKKITAKPAAKTAAPKPKTPKAARTKTDEPTSVPVSEAVAAETVSADAAETVVPDDKKEE